jgi:DNA-binding XRE family transcriptional regulator
MVVVHMTLQAPVLTPYQAQLRQAHRLRQQKLARAASKARITKPQIEITNRPPLWKTAQTAFDAHVRCYQMHLANRLVRPEVLYLKQRCAELHIPYRDVIGKSALRPVVEARRLIMWEIREKFALSYADVGRAFGRDQSTAISAINTVEARQQQRR